MYPFVGLPNCFLKWYLFFKLNVPLSCVSLTLVKIRLSADFILEQYYVLLKNKYKYTLGRWFFFWEVHRALWAFSAHFDNPLCTLGIKIFSLFHRSKWQVTLMESHTFSWLVTYSKSHMPVMRWKHLLLSLERTLE